MLILSLLIGSIVAGFTQRLPTDKASAAITSYSTWTSISYLQYTTYLTKTEFTEKTTTTDQLFQYGGSGPYVIINGTWRQIANDQIEVNMIVENLQGLPIRFGAVKFKVMILVPSPASDPFREADCIFVPVGGENKEIPLKMTLAITGVLPWPLSTTVKEVRVDSVSIQLNKSIIITSAIAVATYTRFETRTETSIRTHTSAYVITATYGIQQPFSFGTTEILLTGVVVGVLLAAVAIFRKRHGPRVPPMVVLPTQPPEQRMCSGCGVLLEAGEDYCPSCGRKWE